MEHIGEREDDHGGRGLKERAWHATSSNDRSVGIEVAHIGARGHAGGSV